MTKFPYAVEQRLRLIDILLDNYGVVDRRVIIDFFGVSKPQATRDLKEYMTLAPDNMVYNSSAKFYTSCDEFKRVWP